MSIDVDLSYCDEDIDVDINLNDYENEIGRFLRKKYGIILDDLIDGIEPMITRLSITVSGSSSQTISVNRSNDPNYEGDDTPRDEYIKAMLEDTILDSNISRLFYFITGKSIFSLLSPFQRIF